MDASVTDQETLSQCMIPGTTFLLGSGRGSYGELWTGDELSKVKPIGREFTAESLSALEHQTNDDGYTVKNRNGEQWLTVSGQRQIKQVACGSLHVILLEFNGRCWALGDNDDGQLGLGHSNKVKYPTLINGDIQNQRIESVEVGGWFSAFLSSAGQVFTCGNIRRLYWNESQVPSVLFQSDSLSRSTTQYIPKRVPIDASNTFRICKIGCGNRFLLMQDLYTMNVFLLGSFDTNISDPYPSLVHYVHPDSLERRPVNFPCKKIDAGADFSVLLDYQGKLFVSSKTEDYTCQQYFYRQITHVVDVCCSWNQFIALDARGYAHVGDPTQAEKVITLHSLGLVNQIGSGNVHVYARSEKQLYKIPERSLEAMAPLELEPEVDRDKTIIKMTGSYFTTIIHQAVGKRSQLMPRINLLRLKQLLCDVVVICSNYEQT